LPNSVIPVKAGIQFLPFAAFSWTPAYAGVTKAAIHKIKSILAPRNISAQPVSRESLVRLGILNEIVQHFFHHRDKGFGGCEISREIAKMRMSAKFSAHGEPCSPLAKNDGPRFAGPVAGKAALAGVGVPDNRPVIGKRQG